MIHWQILYLSQARNNNIIIFCSFSKGFSCKFTIFSWLRGSVKWIWISRFTQIWNIFGIQFARISMIHFLEGLLHKYHFAESHLSIHPSICGLNPSYCCRVVANLLHTCNPPEAGTLTYSVLFICAPPGGERLQRYPTCVCVCVCVCSVHTVCVEGSNSLHQCQSANYMTVWVPSRGHRANLVVIC